MQKKILGFWSLFSLVVGNMIGAGVYLIPASLGAVGSIGLIAWLLSAVGVLLLVYIFTDMNHRYAGSGGPYLYARESFGDFAGFSVAYTYWFSWIAACSGLAVALGGYVGIKEGWSGFLLKAGAIWLVTCINLAGIRVSSRFQLVTTLIKIVPLVVIGLVGLSAFQWEHLKAFNLTGKGSFEALGLGMAITLWAFLGFESATVPAEDAESSKVVKRATLLGTLVTAALYFLGSFTLMGMFQATTLAASTAPYADAAKILFGTWAEPVVTLCVVISIIGALNGSIFVPVHVAKAAAKDGLFLPMFESLKSGYLITAGVITAILALTVHQALMTQFHFIILLSTLAGVIPYWVVSAGRYRFKGRVLVATGALLYSFYAMAGSGQEIVFYGALFFFLAFPLYAFCLHRRQHKEAHTN